jgi:predicted nuclease with TOPRIM domain
VGVERKGVQGIRTMGALVDSRRTRTAAGALLELSAMANEKLLLHKELERWKSRNSEIQKRLGEIAAKEQRLMSLVQSAPGPAVTAPAPTIVSPAGQRVKVKEFSY